MPDLKTLEVGMSIKSMMKKCCSAKCCGLMGDIGHLFFRVSIAAMMSTHGYGKLMSYSERADSFPDPLGVGSSFSMALAVFAEFFCSLALLVGIGTRFVSIPLIITMTVAAFVIHSGDPCGERELALVYLTCFIYFALAGGGKFSLDTLIKNKFCKK